MDNNYHKDQGRSWMVLVAAIILNLIETGVVKSLGVLLIDIREQFSTHTWVIGLAISLSPGFGSIICEFYVKDFYLQTQYHIVEPMGCTCFACGFLQKSQTYWLLRFAYPTTSSQLLWSVLL